MKEYLLKIRPKKCKEIYLQYVKVICQHDLINFSLRTSNFDEFAKVFSGMFHTADIQKSRYIIGTNQNPLMTSELSKAMMKLPN